MWIELHDTLPGHPKVIDVADELGLPDTQVIGMMVCLWTWAINNRPDGTLSERDWRVVERSALWTGEPQSFFDALVTHGFIDRAGDGYQLHDWMTYAGKIAEKREKDRVRKSKGKSQEFQRKSDGVPTEFQRNSNGIPAEIQRSSDGIPSATVTLTVPNLKETTTTTGAGAHEGIPEAEPEAETPVSRCMGHYQRQMGAASVNSFAVMGIRSYLDDGMEDKLICAAIDDCMANGVRKWPYLNSILDQCMRDGCLTLEAFQQRQAQHQARAAPPGGKERRRGAEKPAEPNPYLKRWGED